MKIDTDAAGGDGGRIHFFPDHRYRFVGHIREDVD
jgi:hypothetical protein